MSPGGSNGDTGNVRAPSCRINCSGLSTVSPWSTSITFPRATLTSAACPLTDVIEDQVAESLDGHSVVMLRQSGESGVLYGSVSTRDIAEALKSDGFSVDRGQITLNTPIKTLGLHSVPVVLHPEVSVTVTVNIARSAEEAERQVRGEDVTAREAFDLDDLGLEVGAALAEAGEDDDR